MTNTNWFKDTFELKKVDVNKLKEWEINPRKHTPFGLRTLSESFEEFGSMSNIVCDKDFTIISGHARRKILIESEDKIDCWVAKRKLNEEEFRKMALLSNQVYGEFNGKVLAEEMDMYELMDIGFAPTEIELEDTDVELDDNRTLSDFKTDYHKVVIKFNSEDEYMDFLNRFIDYCDNFPEEPKSYVFRMYLNDIARKNEVE